MSDNNKFMRRYIPKNKILKKLLREMNDVRNEYCADCSIKLYDKIQEWDNEKEVKNG